MAIVFLAFGCEALCTCQTRIATVAGALIRLTEVLTLSSLSFSVPLDLMSDFSSQEQQHLRVSVTVLVTAVMGGVSSSSPNREDVSRGEGDPQDPLVFYSHV